jgi:hypothetical protein
MTAAHTNDRNPTALDATLVKPIALTHAANDSPTETMSAALTTGSNPALQV